MEGLKVPGACKNMCQKGYIVCVQGGIGRRSNFVIKDILKMYTDRKKYPAYWKH